MAHTNKEVNGKRPPNRFIYLLDKFKVFVLFMYAFIKFAYQQWKLQSSYEVKEIKDIICLHFHPELAPEPALMELKKNFIESYVKLYSKDPILVALPYGYNISTLNLEEFISVLNTDQVNEMQRALYRRKGKIELVTH
jgi:hypothetical protein